MAREIGVQVNVPAGGEVQTEVNMPGDIEVGVTLDMNDTVSAKAAEAWAVGERGGVPVSSGDETYHNNSKWYAQQAAGSAGDAATAKTGAQTAQGLAETAQGKAETAQGKAETAQGKAETAQGKAEAATAHYPKIQNGTWWTWNVSGETWSDTGVKATGEWQIVKTYASIAAMEADYSGTDVKVGEFVMIVSTVEDPDNAKLYVKGSSAWVFIVDMSGATGIQGLPAYVHIKYAAAQPTQDSDMKNTADAWMGVCSDNNQSAPTTYTSYTWYKIRGENGTNGITPQFSVGTVSGLPHGDDPTASIDNTDPAHPVLSLGIPAGASGNETIDDTAGLGDDDLVFSADKLTKDRVSLEGRKANSENLYLYKETSGSVVTVEDAVAEAVKEIEIGVEPVQDLHGYENPWTGGAGKNLLPMTVAGIKTVNTIGTWSGNAYTINGVTFTIKTDSDGNVVGINVNGTATNGNANLGINTNVGLPNSSTYILNGCPSGGSRSTYTLAIADKDGQWTGDNYDTGSGSTLTNGISNITISIVNGTNVSNKVFYPMLRLSTVSDSTFAPYSNICPITGWTGANIYDAPTYDPADPDKVTYPITFPSSAGTVYGGTLKINKDGTGVLTVDRANIASYNGETLPGEWISDRDVYASGTTPTTGAQVVYELATPVTYNLNVSEVITMLSGKNNLWADCGDILSMLYPVDNKAEKDGRYADMVSGSAENILGKSTENRAPYNYRAVPVKSRRVREKKIVGGTVAWNQLVQNGNFESLTGVQNVRGSVAVSNNVLTYTVTETGTFVGSNWIGFNCKIISGHNYLVIVDVKTSKSTADYRLGLFSSDNNDLNLALGVVDTSEWIKIGNIIPYSKDGGNSIRANIGFNGQQFSVNDTIQFKNFMLFDLTAKFGSTIADALYAMEQATAGSGVAWFRERFSKDYYAHDPGSLQSVQAKEKIVTGFNLWDGEIENGYIYNGIEYGSNDYWRTKNYIPVFAGSDYYFNVPSNSGQISFYNSNKEYISKVSEMGQSTNHIVTVPNDCAYVRFYQPISSNKNTVCINLSDPSRNGKYEPYNPITYPLDSSLVLRGIPKLDSNNNLYYDGDEYEADGTVTRKYGTRAYQSGDESLTDAITDGTNTVYKLSTPTTESADPFRELQICDPDGTEEFVDAGVSASTPTRDVAIPVGHISEYYKDIVSAIEGIPDAPSSNGTYVLKVTVASGVPTYSWVSE